MASTTKEIATELPSLIRVYTDGSVERFRDSPYVPPSLDDPKTGVSSKDVTIPQYPNISARLYLPKLTHPNEKLPILIYYHGGAFCIESAFFLIHHRYLNSIVSQAQVVAVSVEYRQAPETPLPAAYGDSWDALEWVTSHSVHGGLNDKEPWLLNHVDFGRVFIGGDSSGANIVHNLAMRAGAESLRGNVKILGAFLGHPHFWSSKPIGNEPSENHEKNLNSLIWDFVYPSAPFGLDNPMINPVGPGAASLAGLGCTRLLVLVAGKDQLRDRGVWYYDMVKESGWKGEVELSEVDDTHAFHILKPDSENAKHTIQLLVSFLKK